MVDMLEPTTIVLIHGEKEAKDWMVDNIKFFYPEIDVLKPATNDVLEL